MLAVTAPAFLTSCDNDDFDTNQFVGGVHLNSFGPSPVARGGELRFIGSGMKQITKIAIPGCEDITSIQAVSDEEIRITVPQTAEPGKLTLYYAGGQFQTQTELTYLEPISLDSFSPVRVKPGQEITLSGEYLNLIKEVSFAFVTDSVNVYAADFVAHSRSEIKLIVPAEAVSGVIAISDAKAMPNVIKSEAELDVVLPAVSAPLDLTNAKGGQEVTVHGTDFDLVKAVQLPNGVDVDFAYNDAEGTITFTLPADISDGAIVAIPASGVKVAIANVGVVVPTELVAEPATGLRADDQLVIKGVNMDQVTTVAFPNVDAPVEPSEITATKITLTWPAMAQSGNLVLNLRSGKTVEVAVATAKPEVTGFDPAEASAGATVTLNGHNLDLVTALEYTGGTVIAADAFKAQSADAINVDVPATAQTGALVLTMANGETVTTDPLTVNLPQCAYIESTVTEGDIDAGTVLVVEIANGEHLTGVQVNGADTQYLLNGKTLYINIPESAGAGTQVTLLSDNGQLTYTYDVIPATHQARVVWSGMFNLGNWDGGGLRIYKNDLEGVPAGATLTFHYVTDADAQIQVNDANWGQQAMLEAPAGTNAASLELTAELLNTLMTTNDGWSETAIVVNGHTAIINEVTVEWEVSKETTIWEGSWESGNWGGNQDLAWGGYDWSQPKAGSIVRIYVTPTVADPSSDWWCVAVRHGDGWNQLPAPVPDQWGQPVSGVVEFELTADVKADLVDNGGLVITGADYILTKVTIE